MPFKVLAQLLAKGGKQSAAVRIEMWNVVLRNAFDVGLENVQKVDGPVVIVVQELAGPALSVCMSEVS